MAAGGSGRRQKEAAGGSGRRQEKKAAVCSGRSQWDNYSLASRI